MLAAMNARKHEANRWRQVLVATSASCKPPPR